MDDEQLGKYILNNIVPLYQDAEDIKEKRVMIKVYSGLERTNMNILAKLRNQCIILYSGVPNITRSTRETNRNYSEFKSRFRKKLNTLTNNRINKGSSHNVNSVIICLLVFEEIYPFPKYWNMKIPLQVDSLGVINWKPALFLVKHH